MTANIFDDQEMLEGMTRISEEINAKMIKENKNEDEIIQEMKTQAFENIRQVIEEEIKENQKTKFSEKYLDIGGFCKTSVLQKPPSKTARFAAFRRETARALAKLTEFCKRLIEHTFKEV
jgi:AAA15 family ATPase/GTPase